MVWVHPKTAKTVSSTTGALVGAGSLKASKIDKQVRILKIVVLRLITLQRLLSKEC
jgi:hypothetical protein